MATAVELALHITAKDDASKALAGVQKAAGGLGKTLGDVGKIAGGFLAANVVGAGVQAFTGFIGKSIEQGIKLGESLNAVNKIFGTSSQTVLDWGKNNATQFGLSQQAFNQLATPLGAILKNSGMAMDQVADKTIILTKRAADMASVFNTDVDEALEAIMSGLKGEADPLEKFGVGLSAAKVESQALADTGKKLASQLTEEEKAAARFNLILKETASVQGDFADTSGEAANAARIQQARMEELQATIGTKLIPVQLKITELKLAMVNAITTHVLPALDALTKYFGFVVSEGDTMNDFLADVPPNLQGIAKAGADLVLFIKNDLIPAFQAVWPTISFVMESVNTLVIARIQGMVQAMGWIIDAVGSVVGAFNTARDVISNVFNGILDGAILYFRRAINSIIGIINGAIDAYNSLPLGNDIGRVAELTTPLSEAVQRAYSNPAFQAESDSFATGTNYVPHTGWAMLHKGEAVIPANQNRGGMTIVFEGPVYGMQDFERKVTEAVRNANSRGGFYGAAPA